MTQEIAFTVRATACVRNSRLDEEDAEVPGEHLVRVPAEWGSWSEAQLAGAVLDRFHESVPVNMPEHFDFTVFAPDGRALSKFC